MGDDKRNPFQSPAERADNSEQETSTLLAQSQSPSMSDFPAPPLTTSQLQNRAAVRSSSTASFISSPLNPASPPHASPANPFARSLSSRPPSRSSITLSKFMPTYDDSAQGSLLSPHYTGASVPPGFGQRGSMVLYRLADERDRPSSNLMASGSPNGSDHDSILVPPKFPYNRESVLSTSGDSIFSFHSDSKYPSGIQGTERGLVAYPYDPVFDELDAPDEEDFLHDPTSKDDLGGRKSTFPWRGILNISVLVGLILALLVLFVFYPVLRFFHDRGRNDQIVGNIRVNNTGQSPALFQLPDPIDRDTPKEAQSRIGFDGKEYELVFSDEFNRDGRSFYPGDDPFWEAVELWYGQTGDLEWYDPRQITTRDGALVITLDSTDTLQPHLTPDSTAPFTPTDNHNLNYRSGMLQSWNKFCFTQGYIEVEVVLPGSDENSKGYWPGAWTMGNLARPGYRATTDGMWPYTYDSCDVGTFPNQTNPDGLGPAAALHSDKSRENYNFELSWLPGQRVSACSCPGSDHPGPVYTKGRGAPEIDIFEVEINKTSGMTQVASQSAQFAPFTHDYNYNTDAVTISDPSLTTPNSYHGSAIQQAISGLTRVPSNMFQGSVQPGQPQPYKVFGFEYWSDANDPSSGYVQWSVDGKASYKMDATAVGPDPEAQGGSGVGQRLIPVEPMSIVFNLGISPNWQPIDTSTLLFPAELLINYVRVYQRKDSINTGCDPKDFPTANYIASHIDAYQDRNATAWPYAKPKNKLYNGSC